MRVTPNGSITVRAIGQHAYTGSLTRRLLKTIAAPKHVAIPAAAVRAKAIGALALFSSTVPMLSLNDWRS